MTKKRKPHKTVAKKTLTRKELRKQKQMQKKQNKRQYFAAGKKQDKKDVQKQTSKQQQQQHQQQQQQQLNSDSDANESIASDTDEEQQQKPTAKQTKQPVHTKQPVRADAVEMRQRELKRQRELQTAARKQRIKQLKIENEEEDKMIARLEKKLKLNRSKDKNRLVRKMFNDGLDYALEFCLNDEEEHEQQQQLKQQRKQHQDEQSSDAENDDDGDDEQAESSVGSSDNAEHDDDDDDEQDAAVPAAKFSEDIYGRQRDQAGNIINAETTTQKYVPPHQRAQAAATATATDDKQQAQMQRLRRSCKGLLNRLSAANLHKIATGIEQLYTQNSRHNMNETLCALLNESLLSEVQTKERMVQEHMVLLAYLHAHIGSEIGAYFLQTYVQQFNKELLQLRLQPVVEHKRLNNLVLLLCYMFLFKLYEHTLLLQLIEQLAQNLCEKSVECLLLIFQCVGFQLRKQDPLAFKHMMQSLQQSIAQAPLEMKENLRLKFMLDTLQALKNNNLQKIPQYDAQLAEQLRKQLKAMLRQDKYVITLNISMQDLLRAEQAGKWWIVGSAWSGNMLDATTTTTAKQQQKENEQKGFSQKLLQLAKQQHMNTAERRHIFCIIMSAEDYVDAFEKVLHLKLKDQRAIAYVILHCCLQEQRSNAYYAHLALKFCLYNRKFQLAFQYASWDRINDIETLSRQQIKNLAKFLQQIILSAGLQLSVLKVVDFVQLNKQSFQLMQHIMLDLLLSNVQEAEIYQVFERLAKNSKLQQFKNSLRLFLQHFLLQQQSAKLQKLGEQQMLLLKQRISYVDNLLAYVDL